MSSAARARARDFDGSANERGRAFDRFLKIAYLEAVTIWVTGQRDVAEFGQPLRTPFRLYAQPEGLGHHEHSRPPARFFIVEREKSAQSDVAVAVFKAFRFHIN